MKKNKAKSFISKKNNKITKTLAILRKEKKGQYIAISEPKRKLT